ncbi:MAG TPA: ABC transporter substrate-binding protein [Sedimentibacter sp.]|nr:ABC transporter substrate-binding protein [Sedimentibacter sp.]
MKKKAVLILVLLMILAAVTACGSKDTPAQQPDASGQMDVLYYAYNSIPVLNWDPSIEFSNGIIVMNNIYEQLLRFNAATKEYEKVLATDYSKSEDGLVWTFKLREGVKFHDGTPFNAEAVKYSIERTREIGQGAAFIWDAVEEIKILDDYTVEFVLSYPAPLDIIASCPYAAFMMSPSLADQPDDWFEQGNANGTGPYKLQQTTMGDEVILTRNEDYWGGWGDKYFEKVIIKKVTETSSRRQMIETGEADITTELPAEDIEALKSSGNVVVEVVPSFTNLMAFFNTQKAPLNDVRVRKALSYAMPYDDVVEHAMGGYAKQSIGAIPEGMWGHSKDLYQYKHDLDKAKELLNEAGIKEGELKLLLTYMSGDEAEKKMAELYKAELSKIGVELEIRAMPWESQWDMAMGTDPSSQQDIFVMYWWNDLATPYSYLYSLFHTEDSTLFNLSYYKNPEYDALIDGAHENSAVDIEEAERGFIAAQEILLEDAPAIFIYDKNTVWIKSPSLKGHVDNPSYPYVVFFNKLYRE